jgi:hypothetical protein
LNTYGVNYVTQTEIHTPEPLVPESTAFAVEMVIEKAKSHKSSGSDEIPADLFIAGGRKIRPEFGIMKICLRRGRIRSLYLSIRREIKHIVKFIGAYHFCQLHSKFYPQSCCQV